MKKTLLWIVGLLPIVETALLVGRLPDEVALHFGPSGAPDKVGSKYVLFLIAAVLSSATVIWQVLISYSERKAKSSDGRKQAAAAANARIIYIMGMASGIFMAFLMLAVIVYNFEGERGGELTFSLETGAMGLLFIVLGNLLPKAKENGMVGLRTAHTRYNSITWQRSNRFAGIAMTIGGVFTVIAAAIFRGMNAIYAMLAILGVVFAVSMVYSEKVYREVVEAEKSVK